MKVYLLIDYLWDDAIRGVYKTLELAEHALKTYDGTLVQNENLGIEEHEVIEQ